MQKQSNESGFTFIEVMIAVAVTAAVAAGGSLMIASKRQALHALEIRTERNAMQMYLLQNVDCAATLPADVSTDCPSPHFRLRGNRGNVIVAWNGSRGMGVGNMALRAKCTDRALLIESRVKDVNGDWLPWESLMPAGLEMCQGEFLTPVDSGAGGTTSTNTTTTTGGSTSGGDTTTSNTIVLGDDPNFEVACAEWREARYDACIQFDRGNCTRRADRGTVRKCARWERRAIR